MAIADQVLTLCGVAVGAATSYLTSFLIERRRGKREFAKQWSDRRFEAYGRYVSEAKNMFVLARRIAAFRGIQLTESPLDPSEGLALLAEAEARRELATEFVCLLAGPDATNAHRRLNSIIYRAEWFARGVISDACPAEWAVIEADFNNALNSFHSCVRKELGIPGEYIPAIMTSRVNPREWVSRLRKRAEP